MSVRHKMCERVQRLAIKQGQEADATGAACNRK